MPSDSMTYAMAGVDISRISTARKLLTKTLETTFQNRRGRVGQPVVHIGHYAGFVELGDGRLLGLHVDGVGTKAMIAQMMRKYDTIGIDCVAMCVNDLICTGCAPMVFLDYIALARPNQDIIRQLGEGIAKGAKESGMAVVGGETAIIPDMLSDKQGGGLDLVGMVAGVCQKRELILGEEIREDDVLIGVKSSGIHANGLSLARKVLLKSHRLRDRIDELDCKLGEELLRPTSIYVKTVIEALKKTEIHGIAHITSSGLPKLNRILSLARVGATIDEMPASPKIFDLIQREGNISDREMYRTFNMGIGMILVSPEVEADRIIRISRRNRQEAHMIGKIERKKGIRINGIRVA